MKKYLKLSKRFVAFLLVFAVAFLCSTHGILSHAEDSELMDKSDSFVKIAANDNLELYLNSASAEFYVRNLADGAVWYSNVQNADEDGFAAGIYRTELSSLLSAVYYDAEGVEDYLNSYASSVIDGSFIIEKIENGFRVTFNLGDGIIELPLEIKLEENSLSVKALTSQMKVQEDCTVSSISLLPFFAAGNSGDEGYLLLPDGSGGIIDFSDDKTGIDAYSKPVYGENITNEETGLEDIRDRTAVTLPVYGIRKNGGAMLCLIEEGAALAELRAYGAGNITAQNQVYAAFSLYDHMEYSISANSTTIFEQADGKLCDISEHFYFFSGNDADYSGMARGLRSVLAEKELLKKHEITPKPYLSVWGGISVKRSVFGILTDTVLPITTTSQVREIADCAAELEINSPLIRYLGWNKQELKGQSATELKISGKLNKGSVSFKDLLDSEDFTFVPTVQTEFSYTKGNHLFSRFTTPASNLAKVTFNRKEISPSTALEKGRAAYFLNAKHIDKHFEKLAKKADGFAMLGFSDAGRLLYEDFGKKNMKRYDMQAKVIDGLGGLSEKTKLVLDNPNLYALRFAEALVNIPYKTCGHKLFDREVPFVQTVLSGSISYASTELNYEDKNTALLKLLETGSMPHYFMYYADESAVKNTDYSELCGGEYKKMLELMADIYPQVSEVISKADGSAIYSHRTITEGVFETVYENGLKVYVNYSGKAYSLKNGSTVLAGGYYAEV